MLNFSLFYHFISSHNSTTTPLVVLGCRKTINYLQGTRRQTHKRQCFIFAPMAKLRFLSAQTRDKLKQFRVELNQSLYKLNELTSFRQKNTEANLRRLAFDNDKNSATTGLIPDWLHLCKAYFRFNQQCKNIKV